VLAAGLAPLLVGAAPPQGAQAPPDSEVAKGIKEVEEGELDTAIFTLDAAARRLAQDPQRGRDLGQAYLYLGIAYLGKGQEMMAKAKFREAVRQIRGLSLSTDQFPPKVVDLVEAAKQEVTASAGTAPPASEARPSPAAAEKKGGSKLPFILLGGAAVAGGGVALAKGGGSEPSRAAADVSRFYGTYNAVFTAQSSACTGFSATLTLSGNADGSNFQILKSFGPVTFSGAIQSSGDFSGSSGRYTIKGNTTGRSISGGETELSGCSWMFSGTR
jgi:hypothetical protein